MADAVPSRRDDPREVAIEEHLPLVQSIARRYASRGEPLDELVQAGSIGLIKAVDNYDPDRGPPLAAYAAPAIEGEIRHHLRRHRRHAERTAATDAVDEIADAADPAPADAARSEARLLLAGGWATLPERERRLLELRYFGDLTQTQIARELGMSQAQVSRLLRATLDRLRAQLGDDVAGSEDRAYSDSEMAMPAAEPEEPRPHSGRLLVRMPPSLHTQLARTAEREGVSLNTLVTGALAGAVGWRDGSAEDAAPALEDEAQEAPTAPERAPRRTWVSVALAANLVVVALAAVLAIVLLVVAWQGG